MFRIIEDLSRVRYRSFSIKDQVFFFKRLSFLVSSGLSILDSLHILRTQSAVQSHKDVIDLVIVDISNGQQVSKSLSKFPKMFSNFSVNVIRAGEESGMLSRNLEYLAGELKKEQQLRNKIISSLVYPTLITGATLCITIFLVVYLFPKIMPVFLSLHLTLPLSTRIVIWTSRFIIHWGVLCLCLILCMIGVCASILKKRRDLNVKFHMFLLRIPIVGLMITYYNMANITRSLGLLLQSHISLTRALVIVNETTTHVVYKDHLNALERTVNIRAQV